MSSAPLRTAEDPKTTEARLEQVLPEIMRQAKVPGLSIALIHDSAFVWSRGFGVRDARTGEPVTGETIFEAASLGKPVFAYSVLKLVDQGKLNLDVPLTNYLPSKKLDDPRFRRITARIVLSHRTGFPNWSRGKPLSISFAPGERFSYSGEGFKYLQEVVEHITGKPIQQFMETSVFDPLGMKSSSYVWEPIFEANFAAPHSPSGGAATKQKPTTANVAATLHTTAPDYARFIVAILKGTGLKKATLNDMLTQQVRLDPDCVVCTDKAPVHLSENLGWGLGLGLEQTDNGEAFWHWGDNDDFKGYFVAYPKQGIGVVYFANGFNGLSLRNQLVRESIGGEHPAFAWAKYDQFDSPRMRIQRVLEQVFAENGSDEGRNVYEELKKKYPVEFQDELLLTNLGFVLMDRKKAKEATAVFELNAKSFPNSWQAYDSLGLIYMVTRQKDLAIRNYQKSLELNPANNRARDNIRMLQTAPPHK